MDTLSGPAWTATQPALTRPSEFPLLPRGGAAICAGNPPDDCWTNDYATNPPSAAIVHNRCVCHAVGHLIAFGFVLWRMKIQTRLGVATRGDLTSPAGPLAGCLHFCLCTGFLFLRHRNEGIVGQALTWLRRRRDGETGTGVKRGRSYIPEFCITLDAISILLRRNTTLRPLYVPVLPPAPPLGTIEDETATSLIIDFSFPSSLSPSQT